MSRAPKIPDITWDRYKNIIRALYLDQDKSPEEIAELLWEQYGFSASRHQIIRRLAKWKFKKYTSKAEWVCAGSQIQTRKEQQGKETELLMNGKPVPVKKLEKALDRYIGPWNFGPQCQKIVPAEALTTLVAQTPVENTGINTCTTPWFRFWIRAEETVFSDDSIASARAARSQNQESVDMVLKTMSKGKQKNFKSLSELLSYMKTVLPQPDGSQRHLVEEDYDSSHPILLLQWMFYACSNNLVDQNCLAAIFKWVIDNGLLELVKQAIALDGPTVQASSSCLLPSATRMDDKDLLLFLLNYSGGPTIAWRDLARALEQAIGKIDAPMVDLLLRNGANPDGPPSCYQGPIKQASELNDGAIIVELLLKAGANCRDREFSPSLLLHARTVASANLLLEAGAAVNHTGRFFCSPIQKAASRNDLDMVNLLLNAGADPNLIRFDAKDLPLNYLEGRDLSIHCDILSATIPPISFAAGCGNVKMVQRLLEAGAEVNVFRLVNVRLRRVVDAKAQAFLDHLQWNASPLFDDKFRYLHLFDQSPLQACISAPGVNFTEKRTIAELLLQSDVDINAPASYWRGRTALQAAAEIGDFYLVGTLIKNYADVNEPPAPYGGLTTLQAASLSGNVKLVECLIQHGGDIHAQPAWTGGYTCLQASAASGSLELVNLLLQMGAEVNAPAYDTDAETSFQDTVSGRFGQCSLVYPLVHEMFKAWADVNHYRGAASALYHAAYAKNYDLCALLLREDALTDEGNPQSHLVAAEHSAVYTVSRNQHNLYQKSPPSPLIAAVFRGSHEIVSRLLDAHANPNACTQLIHWEKDNKFARNLMYSHSEHCMPLIAACYWGDVRMVELLLRNGADPHEKESCRHSPLQATLYRDDFELDILLLLLHHVQSTDSGLSWDDRQSLVGMAVSRGLSPGVIRRLIDCGATVDCSISGKYPMYWAVKNYQGKQRQEVIDLLLKANLASSKVHSQAEGKGQALILAAKEGLIEMVSTLLDAGADINHCVPRSDEMTALQVACREGHVSVAEYLLSQGTETDMLPQGISASTTALTDAAVNGHFNLVVLLLEHGAATDTHIFNEWRPPLAQAAAAGRLDVVHLLLETDSKHHSQEDLRNLARYAEDYGHQVAANMIREWKKV